MLMLHRWRIVVFCFEPQLVDIILILLEYFRDPFCLLALVRCEKHENENN